MENGRSGFFELLPLYVVIFIGFIGYSLTITILTPMILSNTDGLLYSLPFEADRKVLLGFVLALYPLGQFFGAPVLGALSDRYGRKPVLVTSLVVTTTCYSLFAYSLYVMNLPLFMLVSFFIGLAEANIAIAQSAVADVSTPSNRTRLFAYISLFASGAFVVGPFIGGKMSDPHILPWFHYYTPYLFVFALLFVALGLTVFVFRETLPEGKRRQVSYTEAFTNLIKVLRPGGVRYIYLANFLIFFAVFGFFRAFPIYLVERFAMDVSELSGFIAWNAVPIVLSSLWLAGLAARYYPPRTIAVYSGVIFGVSCLLLSIPQPEHALWITLFLPGASLAVALPACASMLSFAVDERQQGEALGNNLSLQVGAEVLSGVAVGFLASELVALPLLSMTAIAIAGVVVLAVLVGKSGDVAI